MKGTLRPLLRLGIIGLLASAALLALTPVLFGTAQPMIHITWRPLDPAERARLERRFGLSEATELSAFTWSYVPLDVSTETLRGIVTHPAVADTDGIDRKRLSIARRPPLTPRRGGVWAPAPAGAARIWLMTALALGLLAAGVVTVELFRRANVTTQVARRAASNMLLRMRDVVRKTRSSEPVIVVSIFLAVVAYRFLSFDYITNDHFTYLTYAHQTALGDLPVRDYDDPGFPLMIALSAAAMRAGGMNLLPEVLLTASMMAVAACVTFRATTLATRVPALALFAAALQILAYPRPYSYPKILVTACASLAFFVYARRRSSATLVWLSAVTAISFLLRHDLAVYVSIATALLLLLVHGFTRTAAATLARYAAVCAIFVVPYAAYLLAYGINDHVSAALSFSRSEMARTGGWSGVLTSGSPLTLVLLALPVAAWLWLLVRRMRFNKWDDEAPQVAATALLLAMMNFAMVRDTTPSRLADVFGPAPVLIAWLGAQAIHAFDTARSRTRRTVGMVCLAAAAAVLLVSTAGLGDFRQKLAEAHLDEPRTVPSHVRRQVTLLREWPWTGKYQGVAHEPLARYFDACTDPSDRVLIIGFLPQVPVAARRLFTGRHSWLVPGYSLSPADQRRMAQSLADHPPAVIVISPADAPHADREWPAIAEILPGYRETQQFAELHVLTARKLPVRGTHAETGLSCLR